jgi:hypothetical protein
MNLVSAIMRILGKNPKRESKQMGREEADLSVLNRLWELSRLEKMPTADQRKEFSKLKGQFERRLEKSLELEKRTRRLARYLRAA